MEKMTVWIVGCAYSALLFGGVGKISRIVDHDNEKVSHHIECEVYQFDVELVSDLQAAHSEPCFCLLEDRSLPTLGSS